MRITGWSVHQRLDKVEKWRTTNGARGVCIQSQSWRTASTVYTAFALNEIDPVDIGDAIRSGFLRVLYERMRMERAAQLGLRVPTIAPEQISALVDTQTEPNGDRVAKACGRGRRSISNLRCECVMNERIRLSMSPLGILAGLWAIPTSRWICRRVFGKGRKVWCDWVANRHSNGNGIDSAQDSEDSDS